MEPAVQEVLVAKRPCLFRPVLIDNDTKIISRFNCIIFSIVFPKQTLIIFITFDRDSIIMLSIVPVIFYQLQTQVVSVRI